MEKPLHFISRVMKYNMEWKSHGKKKHLYYGKSISTNFRGSPHAMGFVAFSRTMGMGKPIHFPYVEIRGFFLCFTRKVWGKFPLIMEMVVKLGYPSGLQLIEKRLQHRCIPLKLAKILRTPFFKEHLQWLLLYILYKHDVTCNLSRWNNGYHDIYKKDQ